MLQVIQSFKTGRLELGDIPAPMRPHGFVLVETAASAISPGTERSILDLSRKSLLGKARQRPDLVKQVIEKVSRDGLLATASAVQTRLDAPISLGYSSVGRVLESDASVPHARPGDRVACGGAGYAVHAEIVRVPKNLCVPVPESVPDEDAAYTTLAAVALHGLRTAAPSLGETVVVVGLGLIGLLTVQLAVAAGCDVIGVDIAPWRIALATELGARAAFHREDDVAARILDATGGIGADAIVVAASTPSNDPLELAGQIARPRARVSLVGLTGTEIPRKAYYEKELSVSLSTSYGPGRYDPSYEEHGNDYPIGYVRWTEQRNLQEVLRLMSIGRLAIAPLRTHSFPIQDAEKAYELVSEPNGARVLGITLTYPARPEKHHAATVTGGRPVHAVDGRVRLGIVGAGNYVRATILPMLQKVDRVTLSAIGARGAMQAADLARVYGIHHVLSSAEELIEHADVDAVLIATRHDSHARLAARALGAGKHVLVEKPPAATAADLELLRRAVALGGPVLAVGYNRDLAPTTAFIEEHLGPPLSPRQIVIRCNAGAVPPSSWVHHEYEGGGRWIGEGCHFVALACALAQSAPARVVAFASRGDAHLRPDENLTASIEFENGSIASITYTSTGSRSYPKERVEVFGGGSVAVIDDFRTAEVYGATKRQRHRAWTSDKGHRALLEAFVGACTGQDVDAMRRRALRWLDATAATIAGARSLENGRVERVADVAVAGSAAIAEDRAPVS